MTRPPETVVEILGASIAWLERRGVDAPRRSVELLMEHVLGIDRLQLYLQHDRPVDVGERDRLRELLARRGQHEPVAHLIGSWEFCGHELEVGPDVLIPRPETEELVECALAAVPADAAWQVVDLGTGSGAIAIAVALARPGVQVDAVDASEAALAVAARNIERHGLTARIRLHHGSWWEPLPPERRFDVVLSNPPYIDPERAESCAADVRRFEPGAALWTPPGRPGDPYAEIAAGLTTHARPGALVVLESGEGAVEAACAALEASGSVDAVEVRADLAGLPRLLRARVRVESTEG